MAEFQKVIRDWRRMCDFVSDKNYDMHCSCIGCPVFELSIEYNGCDAIFTKWAETMDWGKFEKNVEQWADEHPGPVYPTWLEWLHKQLPVMVGQDDHGAILELVRNRMPADIAQKLGIKPKEGA